MFEEERCFILRNRACVNHEVGLKGALGYKLTSPLTHGNIYIFIYDIFIAARKTHIHR